MGGHRTAGSGAGPEVRCPGAGWGDPREAVQLPGPERGPAEGVPVPEQERERQRGSQGHVGGPIPATHSWSRRTGEVPPPEPARAPRRMSGPEGGPPRRRRPARHPPSPSDGRPARGPRWAPRSPRIGPAGTGQARTTAAPPEPPRGAQPRLTRWGRAQEVRLAAALPPISFVPRERHPPGGHGRAPRRTTETSGTERRKAAISPH
jgi:hypothetical protein